MNDFYNFINSQSGDRLFIGGFFLLIALYYIVQGLVYILQSFFEIFKHKKDDDKNIL